MSSKKAFEELEVKRKKRWGILSWPELEAAKYPTPFTAFFNYYATGEGATYGIMMGSASKADDIRRAINEHFGPYFGQGTDVVLGLKLLPGYKDLVPSMTRKIIGEITSGERLAMFHFYAVQHTNYS